MILKNLTNKKKVLLFLAICLIGFIAYLFFVYYGLRSLPGGKTAGVLEKGRFSKIVPEKSNVGEVEEKYGKPVTKDVENGVTSLNYDSVQKQQYDFVWARDNKIIATGERVPENTMLDELTKKLKGLDIVLYDKDIIPAQWLVFLKDGIALRVSENNVYVLVRFAPQTKELFLKNIAPVVGMSEKKIQEVEEPGIEEQF